MDDIGTPIAFLQRIKYDDNIVHKHSQFKVKPYEKFVILKIWLSYTYFRACRIVVASHVKFDSTDPSKFDLSFDKRLAHTINK